MSFSEARAKNTEVVIPATRRQETRGGRELGPKLEAIAHDHLPGADTSPRVTTTADIYDDAFWDDVRETQSDADAAEAPKNSYFRMAFWSSILATISAGGSFLYYAIHAVPAAIYGASVPAWMTGVLGAGVSLGLLFAGIAVGALALGVMFHFLQRDLRNRLQGDGFDGA